MYVPVVDQNQNPLMPTTPSRARRWIRDGKATGFWKRGIYCVRLNVESGKDTQGVVVGIDPGSKKEGFTVKSTAHTFLNIQADAVTWVKDAAACSPVSQDSVSCESQESCSRRITTVYEVTLAVED